MFGSLPEDLVADDGKSELTVESGAWGNLDVVMVAVNVSASDDLSMDGLNVTFPVLKVGVVEALGIVVNLVGVSEFADVGLSKAVVVDDSKLAVFSEILNLLGDNFVEITEVITEILSGKTDLILDGVTD